jgi:hypothetical protein
MGEAGRRRVAGDDPRRLEAELDAATGAYVLACGREGRTGDAVVTLLGLLTRTLASLQPDEGRAAVVASIAARLPGAVEELRAAVEANLAAKSGAAH